MKMKDHLICQVGVDSAELVALLLGESEELDQFTLGILVSPGPEMIVIKTLLIRILTYYVSFSFQEL